MLAIHNASAGRITSVQFREIDKSDVLRQANWTTIAPGEQVTHRIRGEATIELKYQFDGKSFEHSSWTNAGPIDTWVITIGSDGTAGAAFGKVPQGR